MEKFIYKTQQEMGAAAASAAEVIKEAIVKQGAGKYWSQDGQKKVA